MESDSAFEGLDTMFPEPPRPETPPATIEVYERQITEADSEDVRGPKSVQIHLVGQHPLWGHHLWNASKCFASFLDSHFKDFCKGKRVLELGAGGGLPGLVSAMNGASAVILTDYPDHSLIQTLETNVRANLTGHALTRTKVQGYIWGTDTVDLMEDGPFDLVIMSDLVFNHSQHDALLRTCAQVLRPTSLQAKDNLLQTPCVLVFFTHHRPWLAEKDTEFLEKAKGNGWECERIMENYTGPMFKDDPGDERVRGTVHGWRMWRR